MEKTSWGFDVRDIDSKVRPQDDFFHYASGNWMRQNPIPKAESRWGSFTLLRHTTDNQLRKLMTKIVAKRAKSGSPEKMIGDFYRSGMDLKRRRLLGLVPIKKQLESIEKMQTPEDLISVVAQLERIGLSGIWWSGVDQDRKNSERYILYLGQGGLGMPDREYYIRNDPESKRVRNAYHAHLIRLRELSGKRTSAKRDAKVILDIETALAKVSMKKEVLRDVDKTYHKKSLGELRMLAPRIDWQQYFKILGANPKDVIVMQPNFFAAAGRIFFSVPLEDWKTYLSTHLIRDLASFLTPELAKEVFTFYGTVLSGTKHMKPLWRRVLNVVNSNLDELLGKFYVEAYFGSAAKKKVNAIVNNLFLAYQVRIKYLDWMSAGTKQKAIRKLHQMNRKLGYPGRWKTYRGLVVRSDDYVGNVMRASEQEHRRVLRRLTRSVDRKEWFMSPQTVNAYCSFSLNDIVFPAAILQRPFFSVTADDAVNYGAIGSVIGHEITHGFDDQGSKFDGKGNRKIWWTKDDRDRFMKKAKCIEEEFGSYEIESGLKVNGKLTLGENIADLGGLSIAFDAYQLCLTKTGRKNINGYTPEQRFFLGYAATEREQERPEFRKTAVLTDPHSPSLFRVNGPLSNLPEFYDAFAVKKGDKLYREPKDRAKIW